MTLLGFSLCYIWIEDNLTQSETEMYGWIEIGLIGSIVTLNIGLVFVCTIIDSFKKCKAWREKRRLKKY